MWNASNCRHWTRTERYRFRLKCFLKRWVLRWRLNVLSSTESKFDVSSDGKLFQTVAEEWLKAWRPKAVRLWLTCSRRWVVDLVDEVLSSSCGRAHKTSGLQWLANYNRDTRVRRSQPPRHDTPNIKPVSHCIQWWSHADRLRTQHAAV